MRQRSEKLYTRACRSIPGGVNSPARAFKGVGGAPPFIRSAKGAILTDEDGCEYIDYICSWGPMILGHGFPPVIEAIRKQTERGVSYGAPTELEVEMAELVTSLVPGVEVVRMVNSGTEATMSAIRLARAFTSREYIVKFEGCYHGHGDAFLSKAGSGMATMGEPTSPGVPKAAAAATLNARFNDLESVREFMETYPEQIAGVIVEPVVGNMGCTPPLPGFLEGLKRLCELHGVLLIFDEVMTGFRLAPGGAQELFGVTPHISALGKVIGGGLPVGAYGASREIMSIVSPDGPMYQAGTLSGNPLGMAAGVAQLTYLRDNPSIYTRLDDTGGALEKAVANHANGKGYPVQLQRVGSMQTLFFSEEPVISWDQSSKTDTERFAKYFHHCLDHGVYLPCSQFEALFHSAAHSDEQIDRTVEVMCGALDSVFSTV